jgi:hypothetical protein
MDFLKKKMKELLDDDEKKEKKEEKKEDKPTGMNRHPRLLLFPFLANRKHIESHSSSHGDSHRDVDYSNPHAGQQPPYQQHPPQGFPQQHYPQPGGYPEQGYQPQPHYGQQHSFPAPPQGPPAPVRKSKFMAMFKSCCMTVVGQQFSVGSIDSR